MEAIRSDVPERDPDTLRSETCSEVRQWLPDLEPAPGIEDPEAAARRVATTPDAAPSALRCAVIVLALLWPYSVGTPTGRNGSMKPWGAEAAVIPLSSWAHESWAIWPGPPATWTRP